MKNATTKKESIIISLTLVVYAHLNTRTDETRALSHINKSQQQTTRYWLSMNVLLHKKKKKKKKTQCMEETHNCKTFLKWRTRLRVHILKRYLVDLLMRIRKILHKTKKKHTNAHTHTHQHTFANTQYPKSSTIWHRARDRYIFF